MDWYSLENLARQFLMHLADASVRATALALMAADCSGSSDRGPAENSF